MGIQRIFRKIGGQATRLFSKVKENAPRILNKISGQIATPMSAGGNIVGGIGLLTAQPELVALGTGMKAVGGIAGGVNQLTKNNNSLQKSNQVYGPQTGVVRPQMNYAN